MHLSRKRSPLYNFIILDFPHANPFCSINYRPSCIRKNGTPLRVSIFVSIQFLINQPPLPCSNKLHFKGALDQATILLISRIVCPWIRIPSTKVLVRIATFSRYQAAIGDRTGEGKNKTGKKGRAAPWMLPWAVAKRRQSKAVKMKKLEIAGVTNHNPLCLSASIWRVLERERRGTGDLGP